MPSRNVYKPTMLLGLGERGTEAAMECHRFIKQFNPRLSKIVGGLAISTAGSISRLGDKTELLTIDDLVDARELNPYECNYKAFLRKEDEISDIVVSEFESLTALAVSRELEEIGYEIKTEKALVFVFAPSYDVVGSVITVPLLGMLEIMRRNRRISKGAQFSLFVFLPDLSGSADGDVKKTEMARMFRFLSEVDCELEVNLGSQKEPLFGIGLTWLIGAKTEDNRQVGRMDDVLNVVANTVESMVAFPVLGDQSFRHKLVQQLRGRGRFYSSFGSSRVIFPEIEILDLLCAFATGELLKSIMADLEGKQLDRSLVFGGCREFLAKQDLKSLTTLLSRNESGNEIYRAFAHPIPGEEGVIPGVFFRDVESKFKTFSERAFNEYTEKLSAQSQATIERIVKTIEDTIATEVDTVGHGLGYAAAFLSSLQGQDSKFLRGDSLELKHTVDEIEKPVRAFYKALLGLDVKEGSLETLDASIAAKDRRLRENEEELVRIHKALERIQSPSDAEKFKLDQDRIRENSKTIGLERARLADEFEKLKCEIETLNLKIDDLQERMLLRDAGEAKSEEKVQDAKTNLEKTDRALKEAQIQKRELAELRRKIFWRLVAWIPASVSAAVVLLAFLLSYFAVVASEIFLGAVIDNWDWCLVLVAIYGGAALMYFEKKVGRRYREAKQLVRDLRTRTKSNMIQLVNAFDDKSIVRWNHLIHNQALMWTKGFRDRLYETSEGIERIINRVQELHKSAVNKWNTGDLPNSLSKKSVLTKGELIDTFYRKSPLSMEKFLRKKPLSSYVIEHLHQSSQFSLELGLRQFVSEELEQIKQKGVEDFIFPEGPGDQTVTSVYVEAKMRGLYHSAAPLCHLDVITDTEKPEQKVAICVNKKDDSRVPEFMGRLFGCKKDDFFSTGDKNFVEVNRFTIGFPLFQVGPLRAAQASFQELSELEKQRGYSIDEGRYGDYSPFPEDSIQSEPSGRTRKLVFESVLFGFIGADTSDSFILSKEQASMTEGDLIKFLESVRGRTVRQTLEDLTRKFKSEEQSVCLAKVRAFLSQKDLEKTQRLTDIMRAKELLQELNPLS